MTVVQGIRVELLSTVDAPGFVYDTWLKPDEPVGSWRRTGAVVSVRPWMSRAGADPFIPWAFLYGVAWDVEPDPDPVARFEETVRQEYQRMLDRQEADYGWPE